jgi:hypothetical protein
MIGGDMGLGDFNDDWGKTFYSLNDNNQNSYLHDYN